MRKPATSISLRAPIWALRLARTGADLLVGVGLLWSVPATGQESELVTDRPDQTESSETVPLGMVQIETGWSLTSSSHDPKVQTHELPGILLRIGLHGRIELRAGWSGRTFESSMRESVASDQSGFGDADLGAKIRLLSEQGVRPQTALLLSTSLPVGADGFSSERVDPELRFAFSHTLSDTIGLGYNLGLAWQSVPRGERGQVTLSSYLYTLAIGRTLTQRLGAFVELFGEIPASAPGGPAHAWDGGFTFLLRDNLQLDFSAGAGLSDAAARWFAGAGLSLRLPR